MAVELSTTQFWVCWEANGQFCSIAMPFQPLANPPSCIAALYARSTADISSKCSLQIWKTSGINLATQVAPDVWILTKPLAASANTITLICPKKAIETITIQKPVHILRLPTACSATSSNFYIPPRYETPTLDVNVSLDMANLQMINILVQSCSKLVISVTEHLVEVVDKLSTTVVVFFRSERILKCKGLYGA